MSRLSTQGEDNRETSDAVMDPRIAGSKSPKMILIVDDNEDILSFMQTALENAGYDVGVAAEGAQALARQAEHRADLLITDIFMPGQDGIETLRECKLRFPQTRIIVMSAGGGAGKRLDYLPAAALIGANATLHKPFGVNQLLDTVRAVLKL